MDTTTFHHEFKLYDSSKAYPTPENCRMCVISFKEPTESAQAKAAKAGLPKLIKPDSVYVMVPKLAISVSPEAIADAMNIAFMDLQDKLIRAKYEEFLPEPITETSKRSTKLNISDDEIDFSALATYSAENGESGKLNKKALAAWFEQSLEEKLSLAILERIIADGVPEERQQVMLDGAIKARKDLLVGMAASQADLPPKVASDLLKTIAFADDDKITRALRTRLSKFLVVKTFNLGINLG